MTTARSTRRALLRFGACSVACGFTTRADAASWLPYDPVEVKVLMPRPSDTFAKTVAQFVPAPIEGYKRIDPTPAPSPSTPLVGALRKPRASSSSKPPTAYVLTAEHSRVAAWLLYGVALQESQLAFGRATLPYPWTLCVRGRGERHATYEQALAALKRYVRAGITNVDCGAMQVNWHWHQDKLRSFELALDPYPNLSVGAGILRGHFVDTGSWFRAVGLYHTGSTSEPATRARSQRYATSVFARLRRLGVDVQPLLAQASGRHHA